MSFVKFIKFLVVGKEVDQDIEGIRDFLKASGIWPSLPKGIPVDTWSRSRYINVTCRFQWLLWRHIREMEE
jgi:hypothetical protein